MGPPTESQDCELPSFLGGLPEGRRLCPLVLISSSHALSPLPWVQSILEQFNPALENLVYLGNNYLRAFHGECPAGSLVHPLQSPELQPLSSAAARPAQRLLCCPHSSIPGHTPRPTHTPRCPRGSRESVPGPAGLTQLRAHPDIHSCVTWKPPWSPPPDPVPPLHPASHHSWPPLHVNRSPSVWTVTPHLPHVTSHISQHQPREKPRPPPSLSLPEPSPRT